MSVQESKLATTEQKESVFDVGEMSSSEDMEDAYDNVVENLVTEVMEGRQSEDFEELMDALAVAGTYSTRNKFLIQAQNSDVIGPFNGYNQWINEFGRIPEKGSDALWILAPVIVKYCDKSDEKPKYCGECENECEDTHKVMVDCKSVKTFAYSQTVELSEEDKPTDTNDISVISEKDVNTEEDKNKIDNWYQNLVVYYEEQGLEVDEVSDSQEWSLSTGARGFFEHEERSVTVRNFRVGNESQNVDIAERFSTLVHEVAHSFLKHDKENISDSRKEMEAESVAYIVCKRLNIDTDAGVYISNHLHTEVNLENRSEVREVVEDSVERIGETSGEILEAIR